MKHFDSVKIARVLAQSSACQDAVDNPQIVAGALEHVVEQAFGHKYPGLQHRSLPTFEGVDPGADSFTWIEYDTNGSAKVVSNPTGDLPVVTYGSKKNTSPIETIGTSFEYSIDDIDRVAFAMANGRMAQLSMMQPMIADQHIEFRLDQLILKGHSTGIPGLARNASVNTVSAAAPGTGSDKTWAGGDKSPAEVFADFVALVKAIPTDSKSVHRATHVYLPTGPYQHIANTQFLTSTDQPYTILQAIMAQYPGLQVLEWAALETAGTGDIPLAIALEALPSNLGTVIPREATFEPPQAMNLGVKVPVHAKCGGCVMTRPLAAKYMDLLGA